MLECDVAMAQDQITTLASELKSASSEHCILKTRTLELEAEMTAKQIKLDQSFEREAQHETKIQAFQQDRDEAMSIIRGVLEDTFCNIADGLRALIILTRKNANDASRREGELTILHAEMSAACAEIKRLQELRKSDGQVSLELQYDKEALDAKITLLNERLATEHEQLIQCRRANDELTADLMEARTKIEHSNEIHRAAQHENNLRIEQLDVIGQSFTSTQLELKKILTTNRELEAEVKNAKDHAAHTSAQLVKCETELSEVQLTEMKAAQQLSAANRACEALRDSNTALNFRLHNAARLSQELLEQVSVAGADLKSNEEHSFDQMFVIQNLNSQLSEKCRALQDLDRSLIAAVEDRENLMRTSFKLDTVIKEHSKVLKKLNLAETMVKQLLDATALVQEEARGLVLDFSVAMGLIERQIGQTMSALNTAKPDEALHSCGPQDNLVSALSYLEQTRTLLDALRDAKLLQETDQAAKEAARLRLELSEAIELITFLENDRDRSCDALLSEKEGCQALSFRLQVAERKALEGEQRCSALEQKLLLSRSDHEKTKHAVKTAVAEMISLLRDAVGQCYHASNFFTSSCVDLCILNEIYGEMFSCASEDIACIEQTLHDQALVNERLDVELAEKSKYAQGLEREIALLRSFLSSATRDVSLHVHEMSGMLEHVKGEVRDSLWVLEGELSNLRSLAHGRAVELDEAHRQIVEGKNSSRDLECEISAQQAQLLAAHSEQQKLFLRLESDRQKADEALRERDDAIATIALLRGELLRTEHERDARSDDARIAQQGLQELKHATEKQLLQLRVQLQAHKGNVQERILALQVESEEAHMTIAALRKELGVLRADLKRRVANLNGKVLEYDEHRQDICAAMQRQERELDRREAGVEQVTHNLEVLMERILDGKRCQQQLVLNDQVRASRHTTVCCYICFCARMPR
jgi:hypothetical protein